MSAIRDYVQPQIVIIGDLHDIDILYKVTQGSVTYQLTKEKICEVLIW